MAKGGKGDALPPDAVALWPKIGDGATECCGANVANVETIARWIQHPGLVTSLCQKARRIASG
jgi:hypothetical protein